MARPYKTGARRSHPSKIAAATPAHLHPKIKAALDAHAAGTAPLPDSVDHGPLWPSILDQNSTGSCFPAGTQVLMGDFTERPIEQIAEGNMVRTHTGKARKVMRVMKRAYEGTLYAMAVKGYDYPLTMTEEHPVAVIANASSKPAYSYEPGDIVWKPAREIRPRDVVLMPAMMGVREETPAQILRIANYIEEDVWEGDGFVRVALGRADNIIPSVVTVDADFARLVGLFLAEGSFRKNDGVPSGLTFTFARAERSYQSFVQAALKRIFGVNASIEERDARPSVSDVCINNATLGRFFFALCGEHALGKRVPSVFYAAHRSVQIALLKGWLQGDGSSTPLYTSHKSACIMGATSSEALHRGMFRVALLCGLKPGATVRGKMTDIQNALPRMLGLYSTDITEVFPEYAEQIASAGITMGRSRKHYRHDLGFACRVDSITVTETDEPIEVFNLEVDGEHTYVANAVAVHNCTAHAIACALYTSLAAQGKPLGFVPSPLCTYAMTRALERTQGAPLDPLPALTDSGAEIADVIAVLAQHGVRAMRAPSPGGYNSDVDPSNVLAEPDIQGAQEAALNLIAGPYTVDMTAGNLSDVLAAALASGMALDIAFECDDAFQALAAGQVAQAPVDAPDDGGHSTAITGYVPATAEQAAAIGVPVGTRLFWLTNSWGAGWSTGGRVLLAPSFVSAMYEAWPIAIAGGAS